MKKRRGITLILALSMTLLLFLLSVITLNAVMGNNISSGSMLAQTLTFNTAETGVHYASPVLIEDASNSFSNLLVEGYQGPTDELDYNSGLFTTQYAVSFEDNDDLDGDDTVDSDQRIIVNATGTLGTSFGGSNNTHGRTEIKVLAYYKGGAGEYAQATGGSKSNSNFSGEINVSETLSTTVEADPNN